MAEDAGESGELVRVEAREGRLEMSGVAGAKTIGKLREGEAVAEQIVLAVSVI